MAASEIRDLEFVDSDLNEAVEVNVIPLDYIAKPIRSEKTTIPNDILHFQYSYGYNCKKKFNICVVGGNTVIFTAGNIMTFIDIQSKKVSFRRSAMGGGLGFICANPATSHFAVGEKGLFPPIIIYIWPALEVVAILRNGTEKAFTYLTFSQDGSLLCSQGSEPDYFITIWDWMKEKIVLQCKSYGQEVSKCMFSQYKSNVLITAGHGHIKFWKIVKTFTGLKLEGEIGIFDKTEATDIIALLPMPNGMVLCGTESGNMLLWNGNVIKYEISKRIPKTCHDGPITTIFYEEKTDRLLTIGMDGCVKLWAYGPIHKTEISEDMHVVGCLPIEEYEMRKTPSAFLSAEKQFPNDPHHESWIIQDAKGAIWRMTLGVKNSCSALDCLLRAPAGKIVGMSCSVAGSLLAVLSEEGGLYIYDYSLKKLLGYKIFSERGSCLLWVPLKVDIQGNKLLLGFETGIIRMVSFNFQSGTEKSYDSSVKVRFTTEEQQKLHSLYQTKIVADSEDEGRGSNGETSKEIVNDIKQEPRGRAPSFWVKATRPSNLKPVDGVKPLDENLDEPLTELEVKFVLQQVLKPHSKSVSVISHTSNGRFFISGSHDGTVFLYGISKEDNLINLKPIGFVRMPSEVTCINWKKNTFDTVLICCSQGNAIEVIFSGKKYQASNSSYELNVEKKTLVFKSVKSKILKESYLEQKKNEKAKKRERKLKELEIMKKEHGKLDIGPETYLSDSDEEPDPLYIPEVPNPILFGYYTESDNIRLSVGGYDAGYLYECNFEMEYPISWSVIPGTSDVEASCCIFSSDRKYLILGMGDGSIRVIKLKVTSPTDFSDYWILPVHDSTNGMIRKFCFSFDNKLLFSCGNDGNIFCYNFNFLESKPPGESMTSSFLYRKQSLSRSVNDILDSKSFLSLEETRQKEDMNKQMKITNSNKAKVLNAIRNLQRRFQILLDRNSSLPKSQQLTHHDLELYAEITNMITSSINVQVDILYRIHAWNVETSRLKLDKIADCFINYLDTLTPKISSFRNSLQVEGYRLRGITKQFHEALEAVLKKLNQQSMKFRLREGDTAVYKSILKTPQNSATFEAIMSAFVPPGVDFSKMNSQTMRIMERYVKHKQKIDKRIAEWDALMSGKPSENLNDPADMTAIKEVKLTIGDYKLKTNPEYRVASHLRITTMKKYHQLLQVYLEMHETKNTYNKKINGLVTMKDSLTIYLQQLLSDLENLRKQNTAHDELLTADTKIIIIKEILKKSREKSTGVKDDLGAKYKRLDKMMEEDIGWLIHSGMPLLSTNLSLSRKKLEEDTALDTHQTQWEVEGSLTRRARQLYNIYIICKTVDEEMASFDGDVRVLSNDKSKLDLHLKCLEHFMVTIQEELLIIRNYEAKEESLTDKVQEKLLERNEILEKIFQLEQKLEMRKQNTDDLLEQQKEISSNFHTAIENSNTATILKKIFKKKFKPINVKAESKSSDEESSSSESSSDTSKDEDYNNELGFILPIKIDENVCPESCPTDLFDLTLILRSQRHAVERELIEEKKQIDILKKDLEQKNKKLKIIESAHQKNDGDLNAFQREKQNKLNNLDVVVVLTLSQLQQWSSTMDLGAISECVLFSKHKLERLYLRTKELEYETKNQNKRHRSLQSHLHHLKVDCKHMNSKISKLNEELTLRMEKKFGKVVNIMKLEQAILRKHLLEFKTQVQEVKDIYEQGHAEWQGQLLAKQNKATEVISANTEKTSLLAALQEEKTKLEKIMKHQHKLFESLYEQKMDLYQSDIAKLVKIKRHQQKQKESLKEEIMKLSRKTKHGFLPPFQSPKPTPPCTETDALIYDDESPIKTEVSEKMEFRERKN